MPPSLPTSSQPSPAPLPAGAVTLSLPESMQRAIAAYERGAWNEAEMLCRRVLGAKADYLDALNLLGIIVARTKRKEEAAELLGRAVRADPVNVAAHSNYGNALRELRQLDAALDSYDRALRIKPDYVEAWFNRGATLQELGRLNEALDSYDRALQTAPAFAEAYNNRGNTLRELRRLDAALESYDHALTIRPVYAEACNNRGVTLQELGRLDEALDSYGRALGIKPDYAEACNNFGNALKGLKRLNEALESYDRALGLKPDYAEACNNRGVALQELGRLNEALDSHDRALKLRPDFAEAYSDRGNALDALKRPGEALDSYGRALALKPDLAFNYGAWFGTRMKLCEWSDWDRHCTDFFERIGNGERVTTPFPVLALSKSLSLQRKAAEVWVEARCPARLALPSITRRARRDKIHIGYYSADYHNHATAYLMADLFERHDRSRFEVSAFSFGPDKSDEMRQRVSAAMDQFLDVRARSDKDVALQSRQMGVDIAVDLKGFTRDNRAGIFAMRAAPLQVGYIGYPGTMGAEYIDYLIGDHTLVPESSRQHYSEKIAYLPHSYQANDGRRAIADKSFSREELGLPRTGFVFCCFNNSYKIAPGTFDGWMRILRQVDGSVLWLLEDNPAAADNLRKEAGARGVRVERLIFAKRMPLAEHLARHRAADLFIDTLPYNAHTTASDALWAGLPVLTCIGQTFAGRVAASLLNAIELPDLIAATQEEFETLAVSLATSPLRLEEIRRRLERNRLTTPLFDTGRFTRHIEDAYAQMHERYQAGLPPEHIHVSP